MAAVAAPWTSALVEDRLVVKHTFIDVSAPTPGAVRRTRSLSLPRDRQDETTDSNWDGYVHTLAASADSLMKESVDDEDNIRNGETVKEGMGDEDDIQNGETVREGMDDEENILICETRTLSVSTAPPPLGSSDSEDFRDHAQTATAASTTVPATPSASGLGRTPLTSKSEPFRPSLNSKAEPFQPTLNYRALPTVPMAAVVQAWSAFYRKGRPQAYGQYDAWAASRHGPQRGRWPM